MSTFLERTQAAYELIGQCIGKYRVVRKLGEGGMGAVYEVVHEDVGQQAAVKVLHPELAREPKFVERFFAEARAIGRVPHPGLVKLFDFNQLPDGTLYLLMEFLHGVSLWQRISDLQEKDNWFSAGDVVRIVRQIASALSAVHEQGIIHRDLKPENVMLVRDPDSPSGERIKILDFGIAKVDTGGRQTTVGVVLGTPIYMAPEQCEGRKDLDDRVDIYALGVMFYELLSGAPPFDSEGAVVMRQHMFKEPPPLPKEVPAELGTLVREMLAKDRAERPSAAQVVARLDQLQGLPGSLRGRGRRTELRPGSVEPTVLASARKHAQRWRAPVLAAAGVALILAVALGLQLYQWRPLAPALASPVPSTSDPAPARPLDPPWDHAVSAPAASPPAAPPPAAGKRTTEGKGTTPAAGAAPRQPGTQDARIPRFGVAGDRPAAGKVKRFRDAGSHAPPTP